MIWVFYHHNLPIRINEIESDKLSTDMSLTKWKQTNSAIFSALFFISKVRFKPCWVMQATIIICRIKKLWQYLPWTLSLSFTNVLKKKNLFLKYTQPHFIEIIKFIYFVAFSEYMNFSISSTVLKSSICLPLCLYLWKRNQWCNPYQRSYILRRPQNFVKVSPYFWLYVL